MSEFSEHKDRNHFIGCILTGLYGNPDYAGASAAELAEIAVEGADAVIHELELANGSSGEPADDDKPR